MEEIRVQVVSRGSCQEIPEYMSTGAAGLDLRACLESPLKIEPGQVRLVNTGLRMAIPQGYDGQVRPRSGLALKHRIGVLNSPGTIDSDYRGEIGVLLINFGDEDYTVENGDRVAQIVFAAVPSVRLEVRDDLDSTERGAGGFGHTGQ